MSARPRPGRWNETSRTPTQVVTWLSHRLELGVVIVSGLIYVFYTWALLTQVASLGFHLDGHWTVSWALPITGLRVGDRLEQIGALRIRDYVGQSRTSFLGAIPPGESVPTTIIRDAVTVRVLYAQPGITLDHLLLLLGDPVIYLTGLFWLSGFVTYASVRPRDGRWRLLILFFGVTTIWMAASLVAHFHLGYGAEVMRGGAWLSIPIYWHLHWVFPGPDRPLRPWRIGRLLGYTVAGILALAELGAAIPGPAYVGGFLLAFAGILIPLVLRLRSWKAQRDIRLVLSLLVLAAVPLFVAGIAFLSGLQMTGLDVTLLGLGFVPIGYLYVALRRQLGEMEFRANRLITVVLFLVAVVGTAAVLAPVAMHAWSDPNAPLVVAGASMLMAAAVSAVGYGPFERVIERRVLGIRVPSPALLEHFLARITASVDRQTVARTLQVDVLPGLLISQSALVLLGEDTPGNVLYATDAAPQDLPQADDVAGLAKHFGAYLVPGTLSKRLDWIRVVLPLQIEDDLLGLWLLGRHDPDDAYTQSEISFLKNLADQTALVLFSIQHLDLLRQLYQSDLDQGEGERRRLAQDLRDNILNELAIMRHAIASTSAPPAFLATYERLVTHLRQTVTNLRPPLLDDGLYFALRGLESDHQERAEPKPDLVLDVAPSDARYALEVEEYVYRIVQQAYENACRHAGARSLRIAGQLGPGAIQLAVVDDGCGFSFAPETAGAAVSGRRHFGLAGMRERATLIGGRLTIHSILGAGTRVTLNWTSALNASDARTRATA